MSPTNSREHPIDIDSVLTYNGIFSYYWQAKQSGSQLVEAFEVYPATNLSKVEKSLRDGIENFVGLLIQIEYWLKENAQKQDPIFVERFLQQLFSRPGIMKIFYRSLYKGDCSVTYDHRKPTIWSVLQVAYWLDNDAIDFMLHKFERLYENSKKKFFRIYLDNDCCF